MDNPGKEYQDEMDKCIYGDIFLPYFLLLLLVDPEPVRAPEDPGDEERPPGQLDEGRDAQVGRAKIHGGHVEGGGGGAGEQRSKRSTGLLSRRIDRGKNDSCLGLQKNIFLQISFRLEKSSV